MQAVQINLAGSAHAKATIGNRLHLISLIFYSQFGLAAKTNALLNQWIELGDLSRYSCIVKPSLCGATGGGSLSVWMKYSHSGHGDGIISSMTKNYAQGFTVMESTNDTLK